MQFIEINKVRCGVYENDESKFKKSRTKKRASVYVNRAFIGLNRDEKYT